MRAIQPVAPMRITDLLRTIDLFEQLSSDELDELAHRVHDRVLGVGEVLCRSGAPVEAMYVVVSGCLELTTSGTDGAMAGARQLSGGDSFGETALISGEAHSATVIAIVDSRVLELQKDDFEALVATRPRLMRAMLAAVSRRAVQANRRLLTDQPSATSAAANGRIYPVFSPRGGSGKTTVAVSLATRLAELIPQRVGLLDLDLLFDDAALQLNLTPAASLAGLAETDLPRLDVRLLGDYLTEHPSGLRVLVGATSPEEGEQVSAAHVRAALAAMKRQFLVTIVDCGSNFSEQTLAALESADRVLVLCTPELVTLRDVRDCLRVFGEALHMDKSKVSYVFNHPGPSLGLTRLQFETALEQPMYVELPHAGDSVGKPIFAKPIDQLARELRPAETFSSVKAGLTTERRARPSFGGGGLRRLLGGSRGG